jgi:hypothetical protein
VKVVRGKGEGFKVLSLAVSGSAPNPTVKTDHLKNNESCGLFSFACASCPTIKRPVASQKSFSRFEKSVFLA